MSPEETKAFCDKLAWEMVERLKFSNQSWAKHHGTPDPISEESYLDAAEEISDQLFKRTIYGSELKGE